METSSNYAEKNTERASESPQQPSSLPKPPSFVRALQGKCSDHPLSASEGQQTRVISENHITLWSPLPNPIPSELAEPQGTTYSSFQSSCSVVYIYIYIFLFLQKSLAAPCTLGMWVPQGTSTWAAELCPPGADTHLHDQPQKSQAAAPPLWGNHATSPWVLPSSARFGAFFLGSLQIHQLVWHVSPFTCSLNCKALLHLSNTLKRNDIQCHNCCNEKEKSNPTLRVKMLFPQHVFSTVRYPLSVAVDA